MAHSPLPQDIVLLICDELALRRDFDTLYHCALTSKRVASIALEQLYGIQEHSPVSSAAAYGKLEWARLWRSIIMSSVGGTAYPYCAYIRYLSLGLSFDDSLYDTLNDRSVRKFFFDGPMQQFLALHESVTPVKNTRKAQLPRLNAQVIVVRCGESVTRFIKDLADNSATAVALSNLEANYIPHDMLPTWISRLGTLTSLRIRDGSILTPEAASAISEYCPKFSDLTCFYCDGANVDENMAAFFRTLRPNTMRNFQIMTKNALGEETLSALNAHASSLTSLRLGSLEAQAMKALNVLAGCTALEVLEIENAMGQPVDLAAFSEGMLKEVATWIRNCKSLRQLSFSRVKDAVTILKGVLTAPDLRLTSLTVEIFDLGTLEDNAAAWAALGDQQDLEELTLGPLHDETVTVSQFIVSQVPPLADSLCRLRKLRSLNLKQAGITSLETERIVAALPNLEEFQFGGDLVDDSALETLSKLPELRVLVISAISVFTWDGLFHFARGLDPVRQEGIQIDILNQAGETKFVEDQLNVLTEFFAENLNGKLEISYFNDPDELHEDDFSDLSD